MNKLKAFITGVISLSAFLVLMPHAKADVCDVNNLDSHYKSIYCGIRLDGNDELDNDIVETLANQFDMDEEIVQEILAGTICTSILEYDESELEDLPESVKTACVPSGKSTADVLGSWNIFNDIQNSYQKEKAIQFSQKSLEFKFKASEQYWDGALGPGPDAPFDLIVDLNLIEIVLFGSKAQWMNQVYSFPSQDEEGAPPPETPEDSALPQDGGNTGTGTGFEDTGEPGLSVTEEGGGGELPPGCVPPDDPNADTGPGGAGNPLCGNGTLDVLMGETCDDGNTQSGDGCNQFCQEEESGSGDQCTDPDAITFKQPGGDGGTGGEGGNGGNGGDQCPPGSVPSKLPAIEGQEAGPPQEVDQSPEYPGPYLGGTLKQFPDSQRPPCGPGESPVDITVAGETHTATNDEGEVVCLPTEICADPDLARNFLAASPPISAPDWQSLPEDDTRRKWVESIESIFCVNVLKENRPTSVYNPNEGCIDCHITAMADALEKALQTNVSPLVNTTSAFQISSKYGPAFSFNLNTAAKAKLKFQSSDTAKKAIAKANENTKDAIDKNTVREPTIPTPETPLKQVIRKQDQVEAAREKILEDTRTFKISNEVISDQEVGGRIPTLIYQMRDSFANIQSKYEGMVSSTHLDEKKQCIP